MSDDHFNRLRPEQTEALALLAEECGEVVQIVGKILRHGLNSYHPDAGHPDANLSNREMLACEVSDLRAAVEIAERVGILFEHELRTRKDEKLARVGRYLHHCNYAMPTETKP